MSTITYDHPVVVGYQDESSDAALMWAADEAVRHDAPLRVLNAYVERVAYPWGYGYVMPPEQFRDAERIAHENATSLVTDAAQRVRDRHPALEVLTTLAHVNAASALVMASRGASLVVLGAHGRHGLGSLASVSLPVAAHAECPVVVVPPSPLGGRRPEIELQDQFERPASTAGAVVVGVDDSPECDDAIGFAFEQASARGVGLSAVHAWWLDPAIVSRDIDTGWHEVVDDERIVASAALAPWQARFPEVKVARLVGHGAPVNALRSAGQGAELLVVGSRGRGGFASLLLGSVSRGVLEHAPCPVAVVRREQLGSLHDLDRSGGGELVEALEGSPS